MKLLLLSLSDDMSGSRRSGSVHGLPERTL